MTGNVPAETRRKVAMRAVWAPFPGKQSAFVSCPVEDILFGGARGGSKTAGVLGKWAVHAGKYKQHARGVIFRRELPQLDDIIDQSSAIYEPLGATYHKQAKTWTHPSGWLLRFRQLYDLADAAKYLGHQYTFIAAEELTNWPDLKPIDRIRGCLRSAHGVKCQFVATANPGGPGHNAVKLRYVSPAPGGLRPFFACAMCGTAMRGKEYACPPECDPKHRAPIQRLYIPATLDDNPKLRDDPQYWRSVAASVGNDPELLRAWRDGDWDIQAGGMFDDLWHRARPVVRPFAIPPGWYVDRCYDHGDDSPYAVLWVAESNGEEVRHADGTVSVYPRGTLFVIAEEYGTTGEANKGTHETVPQIAARIKAREAELIATKMARKIAPGPADLAIWAVIGGESVNDRFVREGVTWIKSSKGPGSRVAGWSKLRELLLNNQATQSDGKLAERAGLYIFDTCPHLIRTMQGLPRDKRNRDDVDTTAEDHAPDALRYRATVQRAVFVQGDVAA